MFEAKVDLQDHSSFAYSCAEVPRETFHVDIADLRKGIIHAAIITVVDCV